jgi:lysozyme
MRRAVKVPPTPHEFDALVSFHFNTGGIAAAALTRHLNAGHRVAAVAAFLNWRGPASIILRRASERDLLRHGRYPGGAIPVWSIGRTGRVDFSRRIRRLSEAKALALKRPQSVLSVAPTPDVPGSFLSRLAASIANLTRRA